MPLPLHVRAARLVRRTLGWLWHRLAAIRRGEGKGAEEADGAPAEDEAGDEGVFTAVEELALGELFRLTRLPQEEFDRTYRALMMAAWEYGSEIDVARRAVLGRTIAALRVRQARVLPKGAVAEDEARLKRVMSFALAVAVVAETVSRGSEAMGWPGSWAPSGVEVHPGFVVVGALLGREGRQWLAEEPVAGRELAAYFDAGGGSSLREVAREADARAARRAIDGDVTVPKGEPEDTAVAGDGLVDAEAVVAAMPDDGSGAAEAGAAPPAADAAPPPPGGRNGREDVAEPGGSGAEEGGAGDAVAGGEAERRIVGDALPPPRPDARTTMYEARCRTAVAVDASKRGTLEGGAVARFSADHDAPGPRRAQRSGRRGFVGRRSRLWRSRCGLADVFVSHHDTSAAGSIGRPPLTSRTRTAMVRRSAWVSLASSCRRRSAGEATRCPSEVHTGSHPNQSTR